MKKYYIFTLGCQMNISDSQRIAQKLEEIGLKSAPEKEADLVIINACSVRQKAVDRIWGKIKIWQDLDKEILITGCVLPSDRKKFAKKEVKYQNFLDKDFYSIIPINISPIAYIPIMTGCDNFCSYCAVPYTRGREVSRPMKDILTDVECALKNGTKEILLLGQNVNSYGLKSKLQNPNYKQISNDKFIKLINTIDNFSNNFTFNFISSNPHDMSDDLIKTLSNLKKWSRELHLPLQSGDDEILRKMNRKYKTNQFLKLIANLKSQIPNLKLTTDIIVGFPGETKTQFENTVKVCKQVGFIKAYIGQYSPRPGTVAAKLDDNIPAVEKKRRWLILERLINIRHAKA